MLGSSHHYFYVLYCGDGSLYAGYTVDLSRRLAEHNSGKGAKYTSVNKRRPVRMIYAEKWDEKPAAMRAEYWFKRLTRRDKEEYLKANGQPHYQNNQIVIVNKTGEEKEESG